MDKNKKEMNIEQPKKEQTNTNKDQTINTFKVSPSNFEERVLKIKRISKTTKGGRIMRFSALVVIGNKEGTVGFAMAKSNEVPDAIKKAIKKANNNLYKVKMNKRLTVYHEVCAKHGASQVLIKPAPEGKGIVAGTTIRAILELAGFADVYTKSLGSNTSINVIHATIKGLMSQLSPKEIARLRDKNLNEL